MLLFGHVGITVGVFRVSCILSSKRQPLQSAQPDSKPSYEVTTDGRLSRLSRLRNLVANIACLADYRLVLLGSMLPDIVDKPLWYFTAGGIVTSGRGYAHTLLFNLLLGACGIILLRRGNTWLLTISLSSLMHLILDQIWNDPVVLWWPLLGQFHAEKTGDWLAKIIHDLTMKPSVYIPEIVGFLIIVVECIRLARRRNLVDFLRRGTVA